MLDLILAIAHHGLVFGLTAMLFAELVLLRAPVGPAQAARLSSLDAGYGLTALLILLVGGARVALAAKGWAFYQENPWFWGKIAAFAAVGLASVPPTLRFISWRRQQKADAHFTPDPRDAARVRLWAVAEIVGIGLILVCAAAMARYGQF